MTKRLILRSEALTELTTAELEHVAGAARTQTCTCDITIGGSCGIVCHTAGLQCFTDNC